MGPPPLAACRRVQFLGVVDLHRAKAIREHDDKRPLVAEPAVDLRVCHGLGGAPPLVVDGDADGISDEADDCLYTPPGIRIDKQGCPLRADDGDVDGVADLQDDCPYTPPDAHVDAQGCAFDVDVDGVVDGVDRCPGSEVGALVDAAGCPPGLPPAAAPSVAVVDKLPPSSKATALDLSRVSQPVTRPAPPALTATPATSSLPAAVLPAPVLSPSVAPTSPPGPPSFVLDQAVQFAIASSDLDAAARAQLRPVLLVAMLARNPQLRVEIAAGADRSESAAASRTAIARAEAVRSLLQAGGVPRERMRVSIRVHDGGVPAENRRVRVRTLEPAVN